MVQRALGIEGQILSQERRLTVVLGRRNAKVMVLRALEYQLPWLDLLLLVQDLGSLFAVPLVQEVLGSWLWKVCGLRKESGVSLLLLVSRLLCIGRLVEHLFCAFRPRGDGLAELFSFGARRLLWFPAVPAHRGCFALRHARL